MQDLSTFVSLGDPCTGVVSRLALAALAGMVAHATAPAPVRARLRLRRLAARLTELCVVAGALGMLFNLVDLVSALAASEVEALLRSGCRAAAVPVPLVWSLICAIPLWLAAMVGHRGALT